MTLREGSAPTKRSEAMPHEVVSRRDTCARYDNCLDHAIASRWRSFHCEGCKVREVMSDEQASLDVERSPFLVVNVFASKNRRGIALHLVSQGRHTK